MVAPAIDATEIDELSTLTPGAWVGTLDVSGQVVLVDEQTGRVHALNPTASIVWLCLEPGVPLGAIIDDLHDEFGVPRDTIADEVIALLRNLGTMGFLEGVNRGTAFLPIDLEFLGPEDCADDFSASTTAIPEFDARYLQLAPNG